MRKIVQSFFMLMLLTTMAWAQEKTVTGIVTAKDDGLPIPGASVKVKGTTFGTQTDANGKFSLKVPGDNAVLVISFIGSTTQEVKVSATNTVSVVLLDDKTQLGEVVVTALGISKKSRSLGYAVSKVSGDDLVRSGEANVIQGLAAKAAGVVVTSSAGTPGASSKVVLRAASTFSGEVQPLIVIDGVPVDNSTTTTVSRDYPFNPNLTGVNNTNRAIDLNPEDIESVTILKGPAAAALYGARGGNGAIMYTTKRGGLNKQLGVKLSYRTEVSNVSQLPKLQSEYAQGTGGVLNTANAGPDNLYNTDDDVSGGSSSSWGPKIATTPGLSSFDNPGNFFKTAYSHDMNLSLDGGSDKVSFRFSVGNTNQTGVIPNTSFKRTSVRMTTDAFLKDYLKVGGTVSYVNSRGIKSQNGSNLGGIMLGLLRAPAQYDLRITKFDNDLQRTYFRGYDNPYFTANENPFTDNVNRVSGNVYLSYLNKKWLNVTYRVGVDAYSDSRKQIYAVSSFGNDNNDGAGQVNLDNITNRDIYSDLIISGETKFSTDFDFSYMVGHNITTSNFQQNFARGQKLSVPYFYDLSNASDLYASSYGLRKYTMAVFGQADFSFKNMLYLSFTGRNEWASTFGTAKNNFFYPSSTLSWVFSELTKEAQWLSFGKLRYAYSQAGISPTPYNTLTYFAKPSLTDGATDGLTFPYGGINGSSYSAGLGNSALKPERVTGNEIGLNTKFLNNRINLDFTAYKQVTSDILILRPLAPSSGFTSIYSNSGELENRGIEVELGGRILKSKDFNWDLNITWAKNKSKVLKLADGVKELSLESAFTEIGSYAIVGQPLGAFYGTLWNKDASGNLLIGANGLPTKQESTGNAGDPNPDWLGGIRNTFAYKAISLTALIDIRRGGDIYNGTYARLNRLGRTQESADRDRTYVIPGVLADGSTNTKPVSALNYFQNYIGDSGGAAEQFVENVNWFRIRDISLSYRLKLKQLSNFINYIDLSVTGRNLVLITNYKGVDPETSLTGADSNINGIDYFNNPGTKSYLFGVSVGF